MINNAIVNVSLVVALTALQPTISEAIEIGSLAYGHGHNSMSVQSGYKIPATGQLGCFDNTEEMACPQSGTAFFGQDYQYRNYRDNGDGTVTDIVTGLMWQQSPVNQGFSYEEAEEYCEALSLGEYEDWRLPMTKELFSISDFSIGWPYLDTSVFDLAGDEVSKDEQYWTEYYVGTTTEGGEDAAWGVNHGTGHIKAYPALVSGAMGNYARCTRGATPYGINQFNDNGDGTVTDYGADLMWAKADSGTTMEWEDALAYAEESTLAGYEDWRLPNIKELQSLVDYSKSPSASDVSAVGPAIDTNFFTITELDEGTTAYTQDYGYFWSSTSAYFSPMSPEYYYAWYVAFGTAVDDEGVDLHGAGAVRFDTKVEGGPDAEGGERYNNFVRLVRDVQ